MTHFEISSTVLRAFSHSHQEILDLFRLVCKDEKQYRIIDRKLLGILDDGAQTAGNYLLERLQEKTVVVCEENVVLVEKTTTNIHFDEVGPTTP